MVNYTSLSQVINAENHTRQPLVSCLLHHKVVLLNYSHYSYHYLPSLYIPPQEFNLALLECFSISFFFIFVPLASSSK